jgi:oligopeptide transport system permease protein
MEPQVTSTSLWNDALKRLIRNKASVAGGIFVLLVVLAAIFGPMLSSYSFEDTDLERVSSPPWTLDLEKFSAEKSPVEASDFVHLGGIYFNKVHFLGTDDLGRDMMVRILYGARISLAVGFLAALVSLVIGVFLGAFAGYLGGWIDVQITRLIDLLYSIPYMFFVILLMAMAGRSFYLLFIAIGAVSWLTTARIVRGQVISLKNSEFIEAARASGTGHWGIIFRHLIPNTLGPIIVYFSLLVPRLMLEESFLSYLGLGVQAPMASWGSIVADGQNSIIQFPWMVIFPGLALTATLFSLNFVGDGLRDALDPKLKGRQ